MLMVIAMARMIIVMGRVSICYIHHPLERYVERDFVINTIFVRTRAMIVHWWF